MSSTTTSQPTWFAVKFDSLFQEMATLLEFKAGKMTLNGTTVTPDPRRGLISIKNVSWQIIWSTVVLVS
jgi:hypothetical protein